LKSIEFVVTVTGKQLQVSGCVDRMERTGRRRSVRELKFKRKRLEKDAPAK
jgi:hypothetical protein